MEVFDMELIELLSQLNDMLIQILYCIPRLFTDRH
jgi:hypothetical protein